MAAFAVATELKDQVKAAVEAEATGAEVVKITFTDIAEIEKVQEEKKAEIKEKIEFREVVTKPDYVP